MKKTTCPECGFKGEERDFDCLGAEIDHWFCTRCHCEFHPDTGATHSHGVKGKSGISPLRPS
jgi:rubredoxin